LGKAQIHSQKLTEVDAHGRIRGNSGATRGRSNTGDMAALGKGREVAEVMDVSEHFPSKGWPQIDYIVERFYFEKRNH
jgi:hypothetical protein